MPNTEKPTSKAEKKRQGIVSNEKKVRKNTSAPLKKVKIAETKVSEDNEIDNKRIQTNEQITKKNKELTDKKITEPLGEAKVSKSNESEKKESKKPVQTKPKVKKHEAVVNGSGLPISTKKSIAMCKFIKGKSIEKAIAELEEVLAKKKALPMKGEYPHQKGIMSGGYPKKTSEHFIKLLKNLQANANVNDLEDPIITESIANLASRPYGRFGRWRKKRTHVKIVATEKKMIKKNKNKK
ncbi:MAG: hypothetical protein KKF67_03915 [Nanoarchaeota archaeon]|nr:hypothetical protein [Nanoarchaeota archaeon]